MDIPSGSIIFSCDRILWTQCSLLSYQPFSEGNEWQNQVVCVGVLCCGPDCLYANYSVVLWMNLDEPEK